MCQGTPIENLLSTFNIPPPLSLAPYIIQRKLKIIDWKILIWEGKTNIVGMKGRIINIHCNSVLITLTLLSFAEDGLC